MSSANAFNLDQSKILSFGKELYNPLPKDKILPWSKLKAFADNNSNITIYSYYKICFHKVGKIVEKGENAGYQHFVTQYFQKLFPGMGEGSMKNRHCVGKVLNLA